MGTAPALYIKDMGIYEEIHYLEYGTLEGTSFGRKWGGAVTVTLLLASVTGHQLDWRSGECNFRSDYKTESEEAVITGDFYYPGVLKSTSVKLRQIPHMLCNDLIFQKVEETKKMRGAEGLRSSVPVLVLTDGGNCQRGRNSGNLGWKWTYHLRVYYTENIAENSELKEILGRIPWSEVVREKGVHNGQERLKGERLKA